MSEENQQSYGGVEVVNLDFALRGKDKEDSGLAIKLHVRDGRIVSAEAQGEGGETYECKVSFKLMRKTEGGDELCVCCPSDGSQCYIISCGETCP
jgi:hypothetical protein